MSFPYFIIDLIDGTIKGLRNEQEAVEQAQSEDVFVIDVINNEWILSDGDRQEIICDADEDEAEEADEDFPEPDHGEADSDDIDRE